jgi:ADP-ribose pyrophosphatase
LALGRWKLKHRELEVENPWWTYRKDITILPSGKEGEYHSVHVRGSSMVIPLTSDGKMILVSQYRYLGDRESLEFPCGSVKETSTYEETAVQELAEETGFRAESIDCVGEFNPYNGVTDEICRVFLAQRLHPVVASRDETEEFEQHILSCEQLDDQIKAGVVWDGMTLAAWALVAHRMPDRAR